MTAKILELKNSNDRGSEAAFWAYVAQFYKMKCAYNANGNIEYIGYARPGTATSATGWVLFKLTYDASFRLTDRTCAGGDPDFIYTYDDRAGYSYS